MNRRIRTRYWGVLLAGGLISAGVAAADTSESGILLYSEEQNSVLPAPAVASLVTLQVTGMVARGRVTQIFYNPTDEWLSGVYLFPLPENAAVDALRMRVGDRVLEARIAEREEARVLYEEARETGVKASLLAQQRPDVFTIQVAQVGPGEEIEVEIELRFEVRYDDGRFRLRFPLLVAERYKARGSCSAAPAEPASAAPSLPVPPTFSADDKLENPVALRVDISSGYPLESVMSPTHPISVVEHPRSAYAVELADELTPADGDFVLEWTPSPGDRPRASVVVEEHDGNRYAMLTVLPPTGRLAADSRDHLPREAIFVIDTSGSMAGSKLEQAKQALRLALDDLGPHDRFNVIRFSDDPELLFPRAVAVDPEVVATARDWISELQTNGGTRMVPALAAALEGDSGNALLRQVVFVTDGQSENELELFSLLREQLAASRLFTVGIGSAPNGYFMRRAAEIGRGTYTFNSDPNEIERQMTTLLRKLSAPVLSDVEVFFDDPEARFWPRQPGDLYLGEPLVIVARLAQPDGAVRLSGRRAGELLELTVPLAGAARGVGIGKLWARRKVTALTEPVIGGEPGSSSGGSDPDEVRRQVVELALAHGLVTRYTSLVALDDALTGLPGQAPERLLPVHAPFEPTVDAAGYGSGGGHMDETIVVTSQSPAIDVFVTSVMAASKRDDIEPLPLSRKPWSLVALAPGVQAEREPGIGAADPPRFSGRGAASDQNAVHVDGFEITEDSSGEPSFELGQLSFDEVEVISGGSAAEASTPGLRVDLVTPDAGNDWRGSGRYLSSGDSDAGGVDGAIENRPRRSSVVELDLGGRLRTDRLWFWGAFSNSDGERDVAGGQRVDTEFRATTGKLYSYTADTALHAAWHRGLVREDGHGAGPDRLPDATWNHASRGRLLRLDADHVATDSVVLSAGYGWFDRRLDDLPMGAPGDAITDSSGVTDGTTFARSGERETDEWNLGGRLFFDPRMASHDLELGVRRRRHDAGDRWISGGARWVEDGSNFLFTSGAPAATVLTVWHDGLERTDLEQRSGWLQDTLRIGRLTLMLGLRWDEQRGTSRIDVGPIGAASAPPASDFRLAEAEWRSVVPRLGLTLDLDGSGWTVLRAAYGRFASRLGPALASRMAAGMPVQDLELFTDADGDLVVDSEESASRTSWFGVRPDFLAPGLKPELTDEALLALERRLGWGSRGLVIGLTLSHRRSHDLLERRTLVRETTGAIRQAVAEDWLPEDPSTGAFDLSPDLELLPSGRWVNGDRRRETRSASLTLRGPVEKRWRIRGHLSWSDGHWRLGPEFRRFDDPTDAAGSGDDGGRVVELGARDDLGTTELAAGSRWSFHWSAGVELPWNLDLGLALAGREGHPQPYFRRVAREAAGIARVQLTDPADSVRAPDVVTFDARLARGITLGDFSLTLALEAFNLLGADDVLRRALDLGVGRGAAVDETVTPRVWRLGIRLGWR